MSATAEVRAIGPSGPVVLELGRGAGAVVAYAPPEWEGREIEIGPDNGDGAWTHAEVRERLIGSGSVWAVVLGPLAPGDYRLRSDDGSPLGSAAVRAGFVAELQLAD